MPTLRPQVLSGLVVIPMVEQGGGIFSVSIAIDVGESRTPPPDVVSREDLIVELRSPVEGSFEPIASPDPGPLPVHAIRVVQARGEFTYAQGVNAPTELVVTLRGDRKSFPMAQTFAPTRCLGREPKEGGPFGHGFPGGDSADDRGGGLLARAPGFLAALRPGCCVRRFEAPLNAIADGAVKSEEFEMEADFTSRGRRCRCSCCEYRQFVRGTFTDAGGASVRFDMPSGPLNPTNYCEDGSIDEFGPGKHGYYGHRGSSSPGDEYSGAGAEKGCTYRAKEAPGCPPAESVHLEFLGLVIDRCRGRVTAKRKWVVDL
jgi:hypothetical protein